MSVRDFQERQKLERAFFSMPVLGVLAVLIMFALWGIFQVWQTEHALNREIGRLKDEIAKAEAMHAQYQDRFQELTTQEGIDRAARARFNLKKPGEEVVVFMDDQKASPPETPSAVASIWIAIRQWFLDLIHKL